MKVFNLIITQTHFYDAISRSIHGVFFVYYIIYFCKMNDVILPITIFFTVYNHREKFHRLFLNILVKKGLAILVYLVDCPWPHQVRAVFAIP